ncbi:MAG: adenosylcobinamide-phosphate synthase CbiB [bacterium]|nr:adenosylcobinamide-phosphate synthase CbiB [bacterium]
MELLVLAMLLDRIWGDPPVCWHPVRLMGRLSHLLEAWFYPLKRLGGVLHWALGGLVVCLLPLGLLDLAAKYQPWLAWALEGFLLYLLLAYGDLIAQGRKVAGSLLEGDPEAARYHTSYLVSRETAPMDPPAMVRATLESLAENWVDGFLSPLLAYLAFGLPGLLLFKWTSTLDSMIGYRNTRYLAYGWAAAKLDDFFNWLGARLSWLLWGLAGASKAAWAIGWRDRGVTASPNSGWSEASAAGALGVQLGGPVWREGQLDEAPWIGDGNQRPEAPEIHRLVLLLERQWWFLWIGLWLYMALNRYYFV